MQHGTEGGVREELAISVHGSVDVEAQASSAEACKEDAGGEGCSGPGDAGFHLEDLPEGVVCNSLRSLASSCLGSAVRLGSTSKLLFCYYNVEVANDDQLSTGLLQQQENYSIEKERRSRICMLYKTTLKKALVLAMQPASVVLGVAVVLMAMAAKKCLHDLPEFKSAVWLPPALVMLYGASMLLVVFTMMIGQAFKVPDMEVIQVTAWVLLIPFVSTIVLFISSIMIAEEAGHKQNISKTTQLLILPLGLLIGAVAVQILAFMSWICNDSGELSRRSQAVHFWHVICEVILIVYLQYWQI